jgi:superfamily II DNA or RNA helicase
MSAQPSEIFSPGSLVKARGREWIVLPGSTAAVLRVRPVSGSDEDISVIHTLIEHNISGATFPMPTAEQECNQTDALLLRDTLLMSLRKGAGPFRSFANIAVTPRTYQLVPLMMALKQEPIRLLVADDVGIGKTIEACLIAREMLDRGEINRIAVLCPPHLVDQWVAELNDRFHIKATAVTAASAKRLERDILVGESIFTLYPFTVVSLDYIKSQRHRDDFIRACPEFVIVDEAHTCTTTGSGRQQRYHLVFLTATPHSGDETAFYNLLGLLDEEFLNFQEMGEGPAREKLREKLSLHFVQRTRKDIEEWSDSKDSFPVRETAELTYEMTGLWQNYLDAVLDYCAAVTQRDGDNELQQRLNFWGTLALVRCVSSSPAAAARALRTRAQNTLSEEEIVALSEEILDGSDDVLVTSDTEIGVATDDPVLQNLIETAEKLTGEAGDPKYAVLVKHIKELVKEGYSPVVFCRFIATAHYLKEGLERDFKRVPIDVVTGELPSEERKRKVAELEALNEPKIMIATDCLSEGINLQHGFNAVVHYDLSWNPTRHEQREGRVDRFGQQSPKVRATLIYGQNNPVDGAVLQVILRKAEAIRKELGVSVPLPDDDRKLTQTLMKAVLLRKHRSIPTQQTGLFDDIEEFQQMETIWTKHADKTKRNRTIFRQGSLKPEEVFPEWDRIQSAIGSTDDVRRFVSQVTQRLGSGLQIKAKGGYYCALSPFPIGIRERLSNEGFDESVFMDFDPRTAPGAKFMHRSDPFVSVLAEQVLEDTINTSEEVEDSALRLGRVAAWRSKAVTKQTTVLLLRLRHRLASNKNGQEKVMLVEESLPVVIEGRNNPTFSTDIQNMAVLQAPAVGDIPAGPRANFIGNLIEDLGNWSDTLEAIAKARADELEKDHSRVRKASNPKNQGTLRTRVDALTPVDVMAAFVLLPVL